MTEPANVEDATDALCAADPLMADVRRELGRIETWHTEDGQWSPHDPRPVMYRMYANRDTNEITSEPMVILTALLRFCTILLEGNVPHALDMISTLVANPDSAPVAITQSTRDQVAVALSEGKPPAGFERYALGFASQAVGIDASHPNAEQIMSSPDALNNPAVHAVFYARALAVDNRVWDYVREQGQEPVCVSTGADEPLTGDSENNPLASALIRLSASMTP